MFDDGPHDTQYRLFSNLSHATRPHGNFCPQKKESSFQCRLRRRKVENLAITSHPFFAISHSSNEEKSLQKDVGKLVSRSLD